jgi:hypothetical protein
LTDIGEGEFLSFLRKSGGGAPYLMQFLLNGYSMMITRMKLKDSGAIDWGFRYIRGYMNLIIA